MEPQMAENRSDQENTATGQEILLSSKKDIRNAIIALRGLITKQERDRFSGEITRRAVSLLETRISSGHLKPGAIIHLFRSFGEEVETDFLLERIKDMGFGLVVPIVHHEENHSTLILSSVGRDTRWRPGPFQIPEPYPVVRVDPSIVSLFFLPGVAFDPGGGRIGYGKGYYDRLLSGVRPDIPKIAIAFSLQVLEKVPCSKWDIPMTMILTEKETIHCD